LPSESCPRWRENHTASWNLFDGDRRVKIWGSGAIFRGTAD
jgi:hypothetical protein